MLSAEVLGEKIGPEKQNYNQFKIYKIHHVQI